MRRLQSSFLSTVTNEASYDKTSANGGIIWRRDLYKLLSKAVDDLIHSKHLLIFEALAYFSSNYLILLITMIIKLYHST